MIRISKLTYDGLIENLTFTFAGNRPTRVDDAVAASAYGGGFEFKDAVKQANEYAYDANGNLRKNAGTTERDGRNDAKRLCTNVVTVSDEVKPKKRKMQGKAEYSRRTVCKSLPKKM